MAYQKTKTYQGLSGKEAWKKIREKYKRLKGDSADAVKIKAKLSRDKVKGLNGTCTLKVEIYWHNSKDNVPAGSEGRTVLFEITPDDVNQDGGPFSVVNEIF